jgi:hypothetical protein
MLIFVHMDIIVDRQHYAHDLYLEWNFGNNQNYLYFVIDNILMTYF